MKFGCIGEHLTHSFSKRIHSLIDSYEYELYELPFDKLSDFCHNCPFDAFNVTIPYKKAIIQYLFWIDDVAARIGAVNTVVNKNGKLYGYNTDYDGLKSLIFKEGISVSGKKAVILGSGGTSLTAKAVFEDLGASQVYRVSRNPREDCISYNQLYSMHSDAEIIINATPCGMYPNIYNMPVDLSEFSSLEAVIDAIYNPIHSQLVLSADNNSIKSVGGLYMLVSQAVSAAEIFTGNKYSDKTERIYKKILNDSENIVLVGMPSSGKTTVGKLISEKSGRDFYDTDELIEKKFGKHPSEIISKFGIDYFRKLEFEVIKDISKVTSSVISTGGGAILNKINIDNLKLNGKIYFIDRELSNLTFDSFHPLTSDSESLIRVYNERYPFYLAVSDVTVKNDTIDETVNKTLLEHYK